MLLAGRPFLHMLWEACSVALEGQSAFGYFSRIRKVAPAEGDEALVSYYFRERNQKKIRTKK